MGCWLLTGVQVIAAASGTADATPEPSQAPMVHAPVTPMDGVDVGALIRQAKALQEQGAYGEAAAVWERLLAIAEKTLGPQHPNTAISLNNLAFLYEVQGLHRDAELLYRRALEIREKTLGPEHPELATVLNNLAYVQQAQHQYAKAEALYKRSLAIREKNLGHDHPDTAFSLNNLAFLYEQQGRYGDAEPLYRRALEIREKTLGPEHPEFATALNNLAGTYWMQSRSKEAESLLRKALSIQEKLLGSEHPDTAKTINNLAMQFLQLGRYQEAEPLFRRSLPIFEKVLGPKHPTTALILTNLAFLYEQQARYGEAEPLYKRALAIREKTLGPEHPATASSLHSLALFSQKQGRPQEADPFYRRALAIREKALGLEHQDTASTRTKLAYLYKEQGRYGEAEPLFARIMTQVEKEKGPEHIDTAQSINNLAFVYQNQGRYGEAEHLYRRALTIAEKASGPQHPAMAIALSNLATLYVAQGRYGEADPLLSRVLMIRDKVLGSDHPDTATSLNNLATLYQAQGRYGEAELLLKRSLLILEKVLGPEHPTTASGLNNLAVIYENLGRPDQAKPLFIRALAIRQKVLGPEHPETAMSLHNLAFLHQNQSRYGEAEPLYQQALRIWQKVRDSEHPNTAKSINNLALLYVNQGRYGEAESLYQRSLPILEKVLGPDHPDTATALSNLAGLHLLRGEFPAARALLSRLNRGQAEWLRRELPLQPRELRSRQLAELTDAVDSTFTLLDRDPAAVELALESRLNRQGLLLEIEQRQRLLASSSKATRNLAERVAALDRQLASVSLPTQRRPGLQQERRRLEGELNRLLPELAIEPVSTNQVAAALKAVAPRSLLVEVQRYRPLGGLENGKAKWGEARYLALLLQPDGGISRVPLGEAAAIDAAIGRALAASAANLVDAEALWGEVSRRVLEPLRPHLSGIEQLFLSPDGELHRVPFAALPGPEGTERLLGEVLELRLLTTGRDLVRLQQPRRRAGGPAVVMADPDYGTPLRPGSSPPPAGAQRSGEGPATITWTPLPGTAEEARRVAKLLQGQAPITGRQATARRALQEKRPRIFHIATHGYFQPQSSAADGLAGQEEALLRSALVLAGANRPAADPDDDGYLTAAEATGMELDGTELVTLSACETGLGDIRSGEGVYGLQRALAVAGARATLLSLWKVDDAATADFMTTYYQALMQGQGRAEALASTQTAFRRHANPLYRDLHVWAAFQLTGDWRALEGF